MLIGILGTVILCKKQRKRLIPPFVAITILGLFYLVALALMLGGID
jgi:hypothetical protein